MDNKYIERWLNPNFLSKIEESLKSIFVLNEPNKDLDLRGLIVGLDGAPAALLSVGLVDSRLKNINFSQARFGCPFGGAHIEDSNFDNSFFDTCRFKSANFTSCSFSKARIDSPTFDDAVFLNCSFSDAKITSRGFNEYGGRRTVFERCNFDRAKLENLQLRACTFRECSFEQTIFKKCLMVGVKFEGQTPSDDCFVGKVNL